MNWPPAIKPQQFLFPLPSKGNPDGDRNPIAAVFPTTGDPSAFAMGCLIGKLAMGGLAFPIGAAPQVTASSSKPAAAAAHCHPPPICVIPPLERISPVRLFVLNSPGDTPAWPTWLAAHAGDALAGWPPRRADSFQKLEKIGSGTYSNVYKARDLVTGRVVALKKVRMESEQSEESVRFMAREIALLRRLDHPNVVRLEGLVVSRVPTSSSLYLVLEYMEHDLAGLTALTGVRFSESQVKCYMKQLLSGLEHCHAHGVLHRDIKCSNLLLNNEGILKIADFGLATSFDPKNVKPMTNNVVTLWYRPPELLLGATHYGVGVDLWSVGCILAELLTGKPILPARTEVEQLHKIFKLCGTPSEDYFEKLNLQQTTTFKVYKRLVSETFSDLSASSVALIDKLLSLDPLERGSATFALNSDFFNTEPYACDPSSLPQYPPAKEMDRKLKENRYRRKRRISAKENGEPATKIRLHNRNYRGPGAPKAIANVQAKLDQLKLMASASVTRRTDRFPPPHLDGAIGISLDTSYDVSCTATDELFMSSVMATQIASSATEASVDDLSSSSRRKNGVREYHSIDPSSVLVGAFTPYLARKFKRNNKVHTGAKEPTVAAVLN